MMNQENIQATQANSSLTSFFQIENREQEWSSMRTDSHQENQENQERWYNQNRNQNFNYENQWQNQNRAHFDDDDQKNQNEHYKEEVYYENQFFENNRESQFMKSKNNQEFESNSMNEFAHFACSKFTLKCKECEMKFYFNNKLHKHLRRTQHHEKFTSNQEDIVHVMTKQLSIINSKKKIRNHHEYVFRAFHYAMIKESLTSNEALNDLCVDNETFMSLMNRKFLRKRLSDIQIHSTVTKTNVRKIDTELHDTSNYVLLNLYLSEEFKKNAALTHFQIKVHLIDDLKTNVLIDMNIMRSEQMTLDFHRKTMIISTCNDFTTSVTIKRKE